MGVLSPLSTNKPAMETGNDPTSNSPRQQRGSSQLSGKKQFSLKAKLLRRLAKDLGNSSTKSSWPKNPSPGASLKTDSVNGEELDAEPPLPFDLPMIKSPYRPSDCSVSTRGEQSALTGLSPYDDGDDSKPPPFFARNREFAAARRCVQGMVPLKEPTPAELDEFARSFPPEFLATHGMHNYIDWEKFSPSEVGLKDLEIPPDNQHRPSDMQYNRNDDTIEKDHDNHGNDDTIVNEIRHVAHQINQLNNAPDWWAYLCCYYQGQFNPNNVPLQGDIDPAFTFLPALRSPTESARCSSCQKFEKLWSADWTATYLLPIVHQVAIEFDTELVSLSRFDDQSEIFIIGTIHNGNTISRHESLAGHAIYSADVIVVPDTLKDWRFEKNPHVVGSTRIRFFAAAPMMTSDGQVLGVISIFDKEPRQTFRTTDRRYLASFADEIMKGLEDKLKLLEVGTLGETTLPTNDLRINGSRRDVTSVDGRLIPSPLRIYRPTAEQTPTPSASSDANFNEKAADFGDDSGFSFRNQSQYLTNDSMSELQKFSMSDISSLYFPPSNTPRHQSQALSHAIEESTESEDDALWEDIDEEEPVAPPKKLTKANSNITPYSNEPSMASGTSTKFTTTISKVESISPSTDYQALPTVQSTECNRHLEQASMVSLLSSLRSRSILEACLKAEGLLKAVAQVLRYDLIYVAEIYPKEKFPGSGQVKSKALIIAKHGDADVKKIKIATLNKALRQDHIQHWQADPSTLKQDDLASGDLVFLHSDDVQSMQGRSTGFVVVAVRSLNTQQLLKTNLVSRATELCKLSMMKTDLQKLFFGPRGPEKSRPITDPAYPANEATEVVLENDSTHSSLPKSYRRRW